MGIWISRRDGALDLRRDNCVQMLVRAVDTVARPADENALFLWAGIKTQADKARLSCRGQCQHRSVLHNALRLCQQGQQFLFFYPPVLVFFQP